LACRREVADYALRRTVESGTVSPDRLKDDRVPGFRL
jgi:hypothetical protein